MTITFGQDMYIKRKKIIIALCGGGFLIAAYCIFRFGLNSNFREVVKDRLDCSAKPRGKQLSDAFDIHEKYCDENHLSPDNPTQFKQWAQCVYNPNSDTR
jgi:hypothetical protein